MPCLGLDRGQNLAGIILAPSGGGRGEAGGGNCPRAPGQGGAPAKANKKRLGLLNKGKTMIPYKFNLSLIMTGRPTCKPKYACRLL